MNKVLVVIAVLIVLLAVFVGYTRLFSGASTVVPGQPPVETVFPVGQSAPPAVVAAPTLSVPSASGTVAVRNFLPDADVYEDVRNPGLYELGNEPGKAERYSIEYIAQTGFFNVTLLEQPLGVVRAEAEAVLRQRLGLSDQQLCALRYSVAVPAFVSVDASGIDYRFSFCSDAVSL